MTNPGDIPASNSFNPFLIERPEGWVANGMVTGQGHMIHFSVVDNPALFGEADVIRQGDELLVSKAISDKPVADEEDGSVYNPQSKALHDFVAAEEEAKIQADLERGQVVIQTQLPAALWKRRDRAHKNVVRTMIRNSSIPFDEKPDTPEDKVA